MNDVINVLIYIVVLGVVFSIITYAVNKNMNKLLGQTKTKNTIQAYYAAKDFLTVNNMMTEIIVHTGTAVMYHRSKKIIYISEPIARSSDLQAVAACLHEAGTALHSEKWGILFALRTIVLMIIRALTMVTPFLLILILIFRKPIIINIFLGILSSNIIFSMICIPFEVISNKPVKKYIDGMKLSDEEKNIIKSYIDQYITSASSSVFTPFTMLAKYAKDMNKSMKDSRIESYEDAINKANYKRKNKDKK